MDSDSIDEKTEIFQDEEGGSYAFSPEYDDHVPLPSGPWWQRFPKRYLLATFAFLGFCNLYALRGNLGIAIIDMTAPKPLHPNATTVQVKEFDWDSEMQGFVLGSFFYGYFVSQIPGGWFAARVGGKRLFGIGVLGTAILTLLTPPAARLSVYVLVAVRVLEGIFEGLAYPSLHTLWSHWAPPLEQTRLTTLAFSGSYFGIVFSMPVSGLLAQHLGWPSIFYFSGTVAVVWWVLWCYLIRETPEEHETISRYELELIQTSVGLNLEQIKNLRPPWIRIMMSLPVWAIIIAHFSENWGFYLLLTELPTYMKDVYHFDIVEVGFLVSLPYLLMAIVLPMGGFFADWLRSRGHMTTTQVRKLYNCSAFLGQAVCMMIVANPFGTTSAIVFLTITMGLGGIVWSGFGVNHMDIAPQFAGLLMGISNCIATIPGIITPSIVGQIVKNNSFSEWQIIFYITAGIYLGGAIFYGLFASGDRQKWAEIPIGYSPCGDSHSTEDIPFGNG